jgi:hypothetical protein
LQKDLQNMSGEKKQQVDAQPQQFNWWYIFVPGGILLLISGIVIAYLLGKKSKKE